MATQELTQQLSYTLQPLTEQPATAPPERIYRVVVARSAPARKIPQNTPICRLNQQRECAQVASQGEAAKQARRMLEANRRRQRREWALIDPRTLQPGRYAKPLTEKTRLVEPVIYSAQFIESAIGYTVYFVPRQKKESGVVQVVGIPNLARCLYKRPRLNFLEWCDKRDKRSPWGCISETRPFYQLLQPDPLRNGGGVPAYPLPEPRVDLIQWPDPAGFPVTKLKPGPERKYLHYDHKNWPTLYDYFPKGASASGLTLGDMRRTLVSAGYLEWGDDSASDGYLDISDGGSERGWGTAFPQEPIEEADDDNEGANKTKRDYLTAEDDEGKALEVEEEQGTKQAASAQSLEGIPTTNKPPSIKRQLQRKLSTHGPKHDLAYAGLLYLRGATQKEIATQLKIPLGQVRVYLKGLEQALGAHVFFRGAQIVSQHV